MKILFKPLFVFVVSTLLFSTQAIALASGQDSQGQKKRRLPNPPADNNDLTVPSLSLEIKAQKTTAEVGEKLQIEVTMTNTSDGDIFYDGSANQRSFGLEIRDEMGREIARTPIGRTVGGVGGSVFAVPLHAGESIHRSARLDKEFELNKPGKYFVQATLGFSTTNLRKSNTIAITIIP